MTVCIAARAGQYVVAASDRMLTSADIQFEPSAGMKLFALSSSICMMTSGDSALQAELSGYVTREVNERIALEPQNWWLVSDVADLYVKHHSEIRLKRAEIEILAPLNLNRETFLANQASMNEALVTDIAKELVSFELPRVSTILAGIDPHGPQIYTIDGTEIRCLSSVGFAAIGIGSRHATSQFMFSRHAWNADIGDTLILTYYAKKKAEVAPGVGHGTDMGMVGPGLGSLISLNKVTMQKLDAEYRKIESAERGAFARAKGHMRSYVEEIARQATETAAASAETQSAAKPIAGSAPVDQPPEAESSPR